LTTEPPLRREASPRRRARQTGTGRRRHRRLHGPRRGRPRRWRRRRRSGTM